MLYIRHNPRMKFMRREDKAGQMAAQWQESRHQTFLSFIYSLILYNFQGVLTVAFQKFVVHKRENFETRVAKRAQESEHHKINKSVFKTF